MHTFILRKYAYRIDLEKCCKTHVCSQKSASIQPRTSPQEFVRHWQAFANLADHFANLGPGRGWRAPGPGGSAGIRTDRPARRGRGEAAGARRRGEGLPPAEARVLHARPRGVLA